MRSLPAKAPLFAAILAALTLAGCGLFPEQKDETVNWSANKLYAEAKDEIGRASCRERVCLYV